MRNLIFVFLALGLFVLSGCRIGSDPTTPVQRGDGDYDLEFITPSVVIPSGDTVPLIVKLTKTNGTNVSNVSNAEIEFSFYGPSEYAKLIRTSSITTEIGQTYTEFFAELPQGVESRSYSIIARYSSVVADTLEINVTKDLVPVNRLISLSASAFSIKADGVSQVDIIATVVDSSGNSIANDKVFFSTTSGRIITPQPVITTVEGTAKINLVSVQRNDTAKVTARLESSSSVFASIPIEFTGMNLTSTTNGKSSLIPNEKDTIKVTSTLRDAAGKTVFGEQINFVSLDPTYLEVVSKDNLTDIRGEASAFLVGKKTGKLNDTLVISSARVKDTVVINYSSKIIKVDTISGNFTVNSEKTASNPYLTTLKITYFDNDGITPIKGAALRISVDGGSIVSGTAPNFILTNTDDNGSFLLTIVNPTSSGDLNISIVASTSNREVSDYVHTIYISAGALFRLTIGTDKPVITINGDVANITATAYDASGNLCAGEEIFFVKLAGPGDANFVMSSAKTDKSGEAKVSFRSGKTTSDQGGVRIMANSLSGVEADTAVKITIVDAIANVYLSRANEVTKSSAVYELPLSAIVSTSNQDTTADGIPITFSARITGIVFWQRTPVISLDKKTYSVGRSYAIRRVNDYNYNYIWDMGEGGNGYPLYRGEQIAEFPLDMSFEPASPFWDINGNGIRDTLILDTDGYRYPDYDAGMDFPEPWWTAAEVVLAAPEYRGLSVTLWTGGKIKKWEGNTWVTLDNGQTVYYLDYNQNKSLDLIEPWQDPSAANKSARRKGPGILDFDIDWNGDGIPDPLPTVSVNVQRTVYTKAGKADNRLLYGLNQAWRYCVEVWAEVNGIKSNVIKLDPLPIVTSDVQYFYEFEGKGNLW